MKPNETRLLTLVRHAKSGYKVEKLLDEELLDEERPLSRRGRTDAPAMALRFVARGHRPDYLLSSVATRALSTARIFAHQLSYPIERIRLSEHIYRCDEDELMSLACKMNDQYRHVCWFGHNPSFTRFLNTLCGVDIDNIPTCGVAYIELEVSSWQEVKPGVGTLQHFDYPKLMSV